MDERLALLALDAVYQRERVVVDLPLEQDLRTVRLTYADDRCRHAPRHHDGRRRAERRCRERDALGVTPGGGRDDPPTPCRVIERRDLVESASHLEGSRRFEGLDLEMDVGAEVR